MKIIQTNLPEKSVLNTTFTKYNYIDCFQGSFINSRKALTPTKAIKVFFLSIPKWAKLLLGFRNRIVSAFGLKTVDNTGKIQFQKTHSLKKGDQLGFLNIFDATPEELIFGMDDKHLNFRGSLLLEETKNSSQKKVTISTLVLYNNWFGRFYFFLIKPLHKVIIKAMLKEAIHNMEH